MGKSSKVYLIPIGGSSLRPGRDVYNCRTVRYFTRL